jgi:FkbM family methyltransferase
MGGSAAMNPIRRLRQLLRQGSRPVYHGLGGLDRKLERACPDICSARTIYIEAGANDGLSQSNTYFLEKKYGARGLLIEASPSSFEKLLANRSARNIFECCALVPDDYPEKFVEMIYANLMTTAAAVDNCDLPIPPSDHAQNGSRFLPSHLRPYRFGAVAATLQSLLAKHRITRVDIFSLDVEGFELGVLQGVDLTAVDIARLLIECRNIDRMDAFLSRAGYVLKDQLSRHDYLFAKPGIVTTAVGPGALS